MMMPETSCPSQSHASLADSWLTNGIGLEEHIYEGGDPEKIVLLKNSIACASAEAKALISIILNAPGEIFQIFGRERSRKMRELYIISILVRAGNSYKDAQRIFAEAKGIVSSIL